MPVFLKSLCDRLNAISINEFLSDTKELVDALRLKLPNLIDILVQDGNEIACNCSEYKGKIEDANEAKLHRALSLSSFNGVDPLLEILNNRKTAIVSIVNKKQTEDPQDDYKQSCTEC